MKKILFSILVICFLTVCTAKNACALIIDPAAIAMVISNYAQTITDTTQKVSYDVKQLQQKAIQGLDINYLKKYINSVINKYISIDAKESQLTARIDSTKAKNENLLKEQKELYTAAVKKEYQMKLKIAKDKLNSANKELSEKQAELSKTEAARDVAKQKYERLQGTGSTEEIEALDEYTDLQAHCEKLQNDIKDLTGSSSTEGRIKKLQKVISGDGVEKGLEQLSKEVGTALDEKWHNMQFREDTIKKANDVTEFIKGSLEKAKDWGKMKDLDEFTVSDEDYKKFVETYFYLQDEDDLKNTNLQDKELEDKRQEHQAMIDQIMRQRKYLIINTASHLLQVSATTRREIPMRESVIKNMFEKTKTDPSELGAIVAYSNTRLENARALTLYARLLAAKLQYLSAYELYSLHPVKQGETKQEDAGKSYKEFDLEKYILTEDFVQKLKKNSNLGNVINKMQSVGIGN